MSVLMEVFNHLVLPPQLPGKQDTNIATSTLSRLASHGQTPPWYAIRQYLRRCQCLHINGQLEKRTLISTFCNFNEEQPLLLHIAEQNAALIIRYNSRYGSCPWPLTQYESYS